MLHFIGGAITMLSQGGTRNNPDPSLFYDVTFSSNEARSPSPAPEISQSGQGGAVTIKFAAPSFERCFFVRNKAIATGYDASKGGAVM